MRRLAQSDLGDLVAQGRGAEIYACGDDLVAKVFKPSVRSSVARREFELTRAIHAAGAPAWRVDELVSVDGRPAIIGERIRGVTLADLVGRSIRELPGVVRALVRAQDEISRLDGVDPAVWSYSRGAPPSFDAAQYGPHHLSRLVVCHGDLHISNVMLTEDGRLVVIDWSNAFYGPLVADVANSHKRLRRRLLTHERRPAAWVAKRVAVAAHRRLACRKMGLSRF